MKEQISKRQLGLLVANMVIASSLVVLPQSLIDLSLQNTWLVPLLLFGYILLIVHGALFGLSKLKSFEFNRKSYKTKFLAIVMLIFISHIFIRDVRILSGFIEITLLTFTPTFVVTMLIVGCSLYMAWAGIEVIARFNEIIFILFIGVILFVPLSLIDTISIENFEPVLGFQVIPSLLQSTYIGLAWTGEFLIVFLILTTIQSTKEIKKTLIWGGGLGLGLLFILIFSQLSVLGAEIVRYSTYPSYSVVQQIRLTEFLDRLDFVLVALYFPTIFTKFALLLHGINRTMKLLVIHNHKIMLVPLSLLMGIFSINFFENKSLLYEFQIHTWATLGLVLEALICIVMALIIRENKKSERNLKV